MDIYGYNLVNTMATKPLCAFDQTYIYGYNLMNTIATKPLCAS